MSNAWCCTFAFLDGMHHKTRSVYQVCRKQLQFHWGQTLLDPCQRIYLKAFTVQSVCRINGFSVEFVETRNFAHKAWVNVMPVFMVRVDCLCLSMRPKYSKQIHPIRPTGHELSRSKCAYGIMGRCRVILRQ